jgi:hypothetical protein
MRRKSSQRWRFLFAFAIHEFWGRRGRKIVDAVERIGLLRRFLLGKWLAVAASVALGLFVGWAMKDWFIGAMALFSFWIVAGLFAQVQDIWASYRQSSAAGTLADEERWGLLFAIGWRWAICLAIAASLLVVPLLRRHWLSVHDVNDLSFMTTDRTWFLFLLCAIITAISCSRDCIGPELRRPWSWIVAIFRGVVAGYLFLLCVEGLLLVSLLVHITIVGILSAQPLRWERDVIFYASSTRINLFYAITTAGVVSLAASCILLWQLSVWWRSFGRRLVCLGLLFVSLAATFLLLARIATVEIPTISPVLSKFFCLPTWLQWIAVVALVLGLAAAVARRWATPQSPVIAPSRATWRRNSLRYYHERRLLIVPLGVVALLSVLGAYKAVVEMWISNPIRNELWGMWGKGVKAVLALVCEIACWPEICLSLAMVLIAVRVMLDVRSRRSEIAATAQPHMQPRLFLTLWLGLAAIIVCSAPLIAAWNFACYLHAGQFPP